jgi:sterol desaturase/sphingolipid hydroxylase (fatty acid hydroxylase superfamily)
MSEPQIRLAVFIGLFVALAALEWLAPRRELKPVKTRRWVTNWAIVVVDSVAVRLVFKAAAVGGALWAAENGVGLFNIVAAPLWIAVLVSIVALDLAIWASHLASHKIPVLWRLHRMHHSDVDIDVTTAIRFHPIEILLSMVWKYAVVLALGAPAVAVLVFEIILNGLAMFNHANLRLPLWLDRWLRLLVVTPDMHRVHHSIDRRETDSNYGFNLSVWDRIFGTYVDQPALGHDGMTIGIAEWQDERPIGLAWTLSVPFREQRSIEAERKVAQV